MRLHLITCSYRLDVDLCELLCQSVDRFVPPGTRHTLIVPAADRKLFRRFEHRHRDVLPAQDLLGRDFVQVPFARRFWLHRGRPLRGWYVQQLLKLSTPSFADAEIVLHVDSDVCFIRPLTTARLARENKVRLYHSPGAGAGPNHRKWHRTAGALLFGSDSDYFGSDFIAQGVTWRTETVRALQNEIERRHGETWLRVLGARRDWAEYILYGVFVTVAGADAGNHFLDRTDICHSSWHYDVHAQAAADVFTDGLAREHVAVHLQSHDPFSLSERKEIYRRLAAAAAASSLNSAAETETEARQE